MSTEHNPAGGPPAGYETRDASPASLVKFAIGLALTLVISWQGMWWLLNYFWHVQDQGPPAAPFRALRERQLPPLPRIQVEPLRDLDDVRAEQGAAIDTYGWVDRDRGVVHIPISEAMRLLLERGALPVRAHAGAAGAAPPQAPAKAKPRRGEGAP